MFENNEKIRCHIGMLLRDHPAGTTADMLDHTVAYFDGDRVMGLYLSANDDGQFDHRFELTDEFLNEISEALEDWLANPRYTVRPDPLDWQTDARADPAGV